MFRSLTGLIACLCFVSPAGAMLAPARDSATLLRSRGLPWEQIPPRLARVARADGPAAELCVTEETAVFLDGRRCRYEDVPDGAVIVSAEVGPDDRTLLTIYFEKK